MSPAGEHLGCQGVPCLLWSSEPPAVLGMTWVSIPWGDPAMGKARMDLGLATRWGQPGKGFRTCTLVHQPGMTPPYTRQGWTWAWPLDRDNLGRVSEPAYVHQPGLKQGHPGFYELLVLQPSSQYCNMGARNLNVQCNLASPQKIASRNLRRSPVAAVPRGGRQGVLIHVC